MLLYAHVLTSFCIIFYRTKAMLLNDLDGFLSIFLHLPLMCAYDNVRCHLHYLRALIGQRLVVVAVLVEVFPAV